MGLIQSFTHVKVHFDITMQKKTWSV